MMNSSTDQMSHFGWYYDMNSRFAAAVADPIEAPRTAASVPTCAAAMPVEMSTSAIASAECSAINFP